MSNSAEWRAAFLHLRLHFSVLLLPVFMLALAYADVSISHALLVFFVLHVLLYPASNVYNSYHDRDTGSIGGMENPPPVNEKLLTLANILDLACIFTGLLISAWFGVGLLVYILASRMYSNRKIRLKKYPIIGFLVVFFFQGAFTFILAKEGLEPGTFFQSASLISSKTLFWLPLAASFQIGAIYPLTQIYQHEEDLADGVKTISYVLGYIGSFAFSATLFILSNICYFFHFKESDITSFFILNIFELPILVFFFYWLRKVSQDSSNANYKNTMIMNTLAAVCLNLFFVYLLIINKT